MPVRPAANGSGHIHLLDGARKVWGTDEPPINLVPDIWQSIPITLSWPDLPKDIIYGFNLRTNQITGATVGYGLSLVKVLPQELTLPDVTLGTVPAGVNYVDWRVVLNWSSRPSQVMGHDVVSPVRPGLQTDLRGGSGLLEISGCHRRMIHLAVSGGNIVLSRKQSTQNVTKDFAWAAGNQVFNANGSPRIGWTYGTQIEGVDVFLIDQRSSGNNAWRGGSAGASLSDPTNYASTWTGTLLVKPGRYNAGI